MSAHDHREFVLGCFRCDLSRDESEEPTITVRKIAATVPISIEAMLYAGLITEEQAREMGWTPPPPTPRPRRWKWALLSWWWDHKPHAHLGPCDHGDCA